MITKTRWESVRDVLCMYSPMFASYRRRFPADGAIDAAALPIRGTHPRPRAARTSEAGLSNRIVGSVSADEGDLRR